MIDTFVKYAVIPLSIITWYIVKKRNEKLSDFPAAANDKLFNYGCLLVLGITCLVMITKYQVNIDYLLNWKKIVFIPLLWSIAYVDYKKLLVLNEYLVLGFILRGILIIPELILNFSNIIPCLLSELLMVVILFAFGCIVRFVSHQGMGIGDIKLFMLFPLFMGASSSLTALFYGMIIIFIQSCFVLITGKKGRKDVLPLAPSLALGAWIAMLF